MANPPLQTFDFSLLNSPDFKEDSVREEIIQPILQALGYSAGGVNQIIRSRTLAHPFVHIGSKNRKINVIPDYLLLVEGKTKWVLDAKAPGEDIVSGGNVEQVFSYAIHPDIRASLYALCNGKELSVFQIYRQDPVLYCQLSEIDKHWQNIITLLSPQSFVSKPQISFTSAEKYDLDYASIKALGEINPEKQSARRHFGVHGYFTKQVWNVVQEYIKNFTQVGDVVLDPYGGSGVTLVEALMLRRKGIHVDLNPLSIFIVENLIRPVSIGQLVTEFDNIKQQFELHAPHSDADIKLALETYPYPKGITLPKDSDVQTIEQLFTPHQLAQLAYLKYLIKQVDDYGIRGVLLLMFSGLLNKINLTYHASGVRSEGRGDSGMFRYYRYRMAPKPADLDVMKYFESRLQKVVAAKREIAPLLTPETVKNAQIYKGTATELKGVKTESVDYIYTDPPYGSKIKYLDLSVMWNAWLDLPVTSEDYTLEVIEGGELNKDKDDYASLLAKSIEEMYRVLKFNRWMSFVFAHKDPAYWHLIVDTAEKAGFEYKGAVKQSNDKISFKKHQNPFTVLSGQLIINFKKIKNPKAIMKVALGANITDIIMETIEGVIALKTGATLEEINDELIIKGLELGFLDILSREYQDITPLLTNNFTYDDATKKFQIPKSNKFKSRIDLKVRIRYFLISYMRRMEQQGHYPTFDEIVLNIMPLLKNGVTPNDQTILTVLEDIAVRVGDNEWKLNDGQQLTLPF